MLGGAGTVGPMKFHTPYDLRSASRPRSFLIVLPLTICACAQLPVWLAIEALEWIEELLTWGGNELMRWAGWKGPGIDQ